MANTDVVKGFRPVDRNGGNYSGAARTYHIAAGLANTIFVGDIVAMLSTTDATGAYMDIDQCTTSLLPCGVVVGFRPTYTDLSIHSYSPASTEGWALVVDDPNVILAVQADDAWPITAFGMNFDLVDAGGDTTQQTSGMEADYGTANTTSTLMFTALGLHNRPDNSVNAAGNDILCRFNEHIFGSVGTTAVA